MSFSFSCSSLFSVPSIYLFFYQSPILGEKTHRACVLFAAIGLLSCLVTCIFPPPQICLECSVSVISCLLSDTAGQQRTPQLHTVTSRLLAAPEQRCSLMPRVVPYVALCVGPYSTARCLRPTRPTAQASFGPLHAGPMGAPSCHPQVLLKTSAAVVGVGG